MAAVEDDKTKPQTLTVLPSGKELQYVRRGMLGTIQWSDGGVVPEQLQGGWSGFREAKAAAESYVLTRRETESRRKTK